MSYAFALEVKVLIQMKFGLDVLHADETTELALALDKSEERRDRAEILMAKYQPSSAINGQINQALSL